MMDMKSSSTLSINLTKLNDNACRVNDLCRAQGITVAGVVKAGCGNAQIARAIADSGVAMLADSRIDNIRRLQQVGLSQPMLLLRSPAPGQADAVVRCCQLSLNSELRSLQALSLAAEAQHRQHDIILMLELGDRREGLLPKKLPEMVARVADLPGIRIAGLGTNLGCLGGVRTTATNLGQLVHYAEQVEQQLQRPLQYISGGNSGCLPLLLQGNMPERINHLRIGFGILQGRDPFSDEPMAGLHTDVFGLNVDLIEMQRKHSLPDGEIVVDAFGNVPQFEDKGEQVRGIASIGRLDTELATLKPCDNDIDIIGASSDHLVLDMTRTEGYTVGDKVSFAAGYGATVQAMISPYVDKLFINQASEHLQQAEPLIFCQPDVMDWIGKDDWLCAVEKQTLLKFTVASALCQVREESRLSILVVDERDSWATSMLPERAMDLVWLDSTPCYQPGVRTGSTAQDVLYKLLDWDSGYTGFSPQRSTLIGLTEISTTEAQYIERDQLTVFTMEDIDSLGIREVMREVLHKHLAGNEHIALYLNLSVLEDPDHSPGGVSFRELCQVMELLVDSKRLRRVVVSGVYASANKRHLCHFLRTLCGHRISRPSYCLSMCHPAIVQT